MNAVDIIKESEGLRLTAYPDPGTGNKPYTIGYGHTKGVSLGDTCTKEQAEQWLREDIAEYYSAIDRLVTVPLTDKQRDALCSLVYNIGAGAFEKSTLLKRLNAGKYTESAAQFPRWNIAGGRVMRGLTIRRGKERALFLAGTNSLLLDSIPPLPEHKMIPPFIIPVAIELIKELPNFAKIFSKEDVSERNIEAIVKATDIVVNSVGAVNAQEAVEKIKSDPEAQTVANEAVKSNTADLIDSLERINAIEQANIRDARYYNTEENALVGKWKAWHLLALLVVSAALMAMGFIIVTSDDIAERTMVLQVLLLGGFGVVMSFVFGSSNGSKTKEKLLDRDT